jgi:GNAT superfamily N-acetyltransferase
MIPGKAAIRVVLTSPSHARRLAQMQRVIFPTLTDEELLTEDHFRHHIRLFPEGQFTALVHVHDKWVVAGSTSTFRTTWSFIEKPHTFLEAIGGGWLTHHNPRGDWLYGADLSVHPDFRGCGVGSALYVARAEAARRLNLRGEAAGGMIPGYERCRAEMSVERYVEKVVKGELKDPTLSMQLKNGFKVRGILYDHITDPRANDCAALIVRENPHYNRAEV